MPYSPPIQKDSFISSLSRNLHALVLMLRPAVYLKCKALRKKWPSLMRLRRENHQFQAKSGYKSLSKILSHKKEGRRALDPHNLPYAMWIHLPVFLLYINPFFLSFKSNLSTSIFKKPHILSLIFFSQDSLCSSGCSGTH